MRWLPFNLLVWFFICVALIQHIITGKVDFLGLCVGIILGLCSGLLSFLHLSHLASKGKFDLSRNKQQRRLFILSLMVVVFVGGIILGYARIRYFPQIDISKMLGTFILVFCTIGLAIYVAGMYFLQRRYGEVFYASHMSKHNTWRSMSRVAIVLCVLGAGGLILFGLHHVSAWWGLLFGAALWIASYIVARIQEQNDK